MKLATIGVPIFLVIWLVFGWMLSYAEGASVPLAPEIGTKLVPRGHLDAWERYPSGLLRGKGDKITTITPEKTYIVTGKKVIEVLLFGDQYYLQIRPTDESGSDWASAWVFQGREGAEFPPNLVPPGVACSQSENSSLGYDCIDG